jgi:hypothetical protein
MPNGSGPERPLACARKTVDDRAPHLQLPCRSRAVVGMPVYPARNNCPRGCPNCNTQIMELIRGTKLSESSDARVYSVRMTIARLLLAQPRVVILDDARGTAGCGWAARGTAPHPVRGAEERCGRRGSGERELTLAGQNRFRGLAYAKTSSRNAVIAAQLRASAFGR